MSNSVLINWEIKSKERAKVYKGFLEKANKNAVLKALPDLHETAFEQVDCLSCGNCCKGYSPRFKTPDIKRISKVLGLRESVFIDKYLTIDQEGDYVLISKPCPFLGNDNVCSIYEDRPSDCKRFPYTDEDVFIKRQALTLKNSSFCPVVYVVLEKLCSQVGL
jgi:Fe-S-cluster containining protein